MEINHSEAGTHVKFHFDNLTQFSEAGIPVFFSF